MTSRARWMYFKLRYMEIPRLFAKAYFLKMKRFIAGSKPVPETLKLDKSFSA